MADGYSQIRDILQATVAAILSPFWEVTVALGVLKKLNEFIR